MKTRSTVYMEKALRDSIKIYCKRNYVSISDYMSASYTILLERNDQKILELAKAIKTKRIEEKVKKLKAAYDKKIERLNNDTIRKD